MAIDIAFGPAEGLLEEEYDGMKRVWLNDHDTEAEARKEQNGLARLLVAKGLTPSHTIDVKFKKGKWWTILVVEDDEDEPLEDA
jgi:hypothetical protein